MTRRLTNALNGNRFIYAQALPDGKFLSRTSPCAGLKCFIYQYGQPSARRYIRCFNCWEDSHFKRDCTNEPRRKVCKGEGHQPGDAKYPHYTKSASIVIPFAGHSNCLSNLFPCEIKVFGISHRSAEHAYQYVKAMCSGDVP